MMLNPLIALLGVYALAGQDYGGQTYTPPPQTRVPEQPAPEARKASQPTISLIPGVAGRGIRDVPNIAIKYYDVSGKDFAGIIRDINHRRPRDPATKQVIAGGAGYALGASVNKVTNNGKCTVKDAKAEFAPTAELPRLLNEQALAPAQLALWRAYLSHIEVPAAAGLWLVVDRIPAFEKSLVGKNCDLALKLGSQMIAQIRADHTAYQQKYAAAEAAAAKAAAKK
jgi:predicted secreted Zn-dependent protease